MEKITVDQILYWLGDDGDILALAYCLQSLLNGEHSIEQSRKEILDYCEDL